MIQVTDDLKLTLKENTRLKTVYFHEDGTYAFHFHECNGQKFSRLDKKIIPAPIGKTPKVEMFGVESCRITESVPREKILNPEIVDAVEAATKKESKK